MKVIFTCGGTAGHINPALALAKMLKSRRNDVDILFIGADGAMETALVPREGFAIETVGIHSLKHSMKPGAILKNVKTLTEMMSTLKDVKKIIKEFGPDIVVGTGGYASFPAVHEAAKLKIPTLIHESNAVPGVTTKSLASMVTKVMVGVEGVENEYPDPSKVVVTGTPVREEFLFLEQNKAKRELGLDHRPVVASFFGSLGARDMNKAMVDYISILCRSDEFQLVHACGKQGWEWMPASIAEAGVVMEEHPNIHILEYIYNMPVIMAAADLIICRAGASTLAELSAAGKPAILIPSPNVAANHQELNARKLEESGGVEVMLEGETDGKKLFDLSKKLLNNLIKRDDMSRSLRKVSVPDASERIFQLIVETAQK